MELDVSRSSLVILRFEDHSTDDDWQRVSDLLSAHARAVQKFAVIADASRLTTAPTPRQRRIASDATVEIVRVYPGRLVAWANVITSPLIRGAATAINWLVRPPYLVRTVATFDEAMSWLREVTPDLVRER
jgi:hypothetical protein